MKRRSERAKMTNVVQLVSSLLIGCAFCALPRNGAADIVVSKPDLVEAWKVVSELWAVKKSVDNAETISQSLTAPAISQACNAQFRLKPETSDTREKIVKEYDLKHGEGASRKLSVDLLTKLTSDPDACRALEFMAKRRRYTNNFLELVE
jgi:hypothetical protein